jgi:hypothetical protein
MGRNSCIVGLCKHALAIALSLMIQCKKIRMMHTSKKNLAIVQERPNIPGG